MVLRNGKKIYRLVKTPVRSLPIPVVETPSDPVTSTPVYQTICIYIGVFLFTFCSSLIVQRFMCPIVLPLAESMISSFFLDCLPLIKTQLFSLKTYFLIYLENYTESLTEYLCGVY